MKEKIIYNLFYEFKNKNIKQDKILELLNNTLKIEPDITKITRYGQNILFYACLQENENVFNFISKNFNFEFKEDFKKCINFTYINKNPIILETALNYLPILLEQDKKEFYLMFSNNCYREENINILQKWLFLNLNIEEKNDFIINLFIKNNKPFLNFILKINHWRDLIETLIKENIINDKFNILLKKQTNNNLMNQINIEPINNSISNVNVNKNPIIKIKRKTFLNSSASEKLI